ncbi:hypothetical protein DICPUDRAFT_78987 [Dictyostelium purpureum]|uniref:Pre-mRNA processing factor 4 (PRP4)-like domain-containing protein n=1 Tax=Dictyostelium purpureum TaxID=5786 RepID=F0ZL79_DICPU|nr:uncharacterized protein DICPUDRAFT_78987 [Dictyostelium purpureum]EGC35300.1 hypothetical protein DICPUDRAFT_78987 [Dictyostelium purpureum]|eukprot:XP_003288167.1 hypothetical protein DICPUDRAFT_78987 [Dictyostelium purpureum]
MENGNKRVYFGQIKKDSVKQVEQNNIPISQDEDNEEDGVQFLPFSKHVQKSHELHKKSLDDYERKKRAKQVIVPTNDNLVKLKLRELGEPIILFGEKPEDRRNRLRELLIDKNILDGTPIALKKEEPEESEEEKENFLTQGTKELEEARIKIALYSLKKSQKRLQENKRQRDKELEIKKQNDELFKSHGGVIVGRVEQMMVDRTKTDFELARDKTRKELKDYYASTSQVGDDRPLSMAVFSPNSQLIAISSWGGQSKLWNIKGEHLQTFTGHTQRASSIAFHPQSTLSISENSVNIATTSADSTCKLWSLSSETPLASLEGHLDVVNRCAFHPNGRYLMTSSNDKSWRMWDLESQNTCILDQEGHSGAVMGIAVQEDGSLLSTGSQDGLVRVWDLRSGRPILYFEGHSKQVISVDWSPNCYHIASSSEDNTTIIWDIRKKEKAYQILAHSSIVSCVKYQKSNNSSTSIGYLATSSFDGKIKCWEPYTWKPITTLEGHSSKVTSVDIANDNSKIVSTSFDKTWKIWSNEN